MADDDLPTPEAADLTDPAGTPDAAVPVEHDVPHLSDLQDPEPNDDEKVAESGDAGIAFPHGLRLN